MSVCEGLRLVMHGLAVAMLIEPVMTIRFPTGVIVRWPGQVWGAEL